MNATLEELAKTTLVKERSLLIMGRGYQYATCLEAALKVRFTVSSALHYQI